jgi:hypothetical protein
MKKIFLAIAVAVVAMACHTNDSESALKEGKIVINTSTRSEVSEANTTSKTVLDEALVPSTKDLKVEIKNNETTQSWESYSKFEEALNEGLTFASGLHTITLSYGEKGVEGWSKPYFEGSAIVDVPMYGLSVEADVLVALANSIIKVETTEQFDGYFPTSSFKINGIDWDASKREMLFMNTGEVSVICNAKRTTGAAATFESKLQLKASTLHKVVFDLSTAGKAVVNITFDDEIVETVELEFELNENA